MPGTLFFVLRQEQNRLKMDRRAERKDNAYEIGIENKTKTRRILWMLEDGTAGEPKLTPGHIDHDDQSVLFVSLSENV